MEIYTKRTRLHFDPLQQGILAYLQLAYLQLCLDHTTMHTLLQEVGVAGEHFHVAVQRV